MISASLHDSCDSCCQKVSWTLSNFGSYAGFIYLPERIEYLCIFFVHLSRFHAESPYSIDLSDPYAIFHTSCYLLLFYLLFLLSHYLDFNICFLSVWSCIFSPFVCGERNHAIPPYDWPREIHKMDGPGWAGGERGRSDLGLSFLIFLKNFFKRNKTPREENSVLILRTEYTFEQGKSQISV